MKQLAVALVMLSVIFSCTADVQDNKETAIRDAEIDFRSAVNGAWVDAGYISFLTSTLSPARARDSVAGLYLYELIIDAQSKESIIVKAYGLPEEQTKEYDIAFNLKPGFTPTSYSINIPRAARDTSIDSLLQEISYEVDGEDTSLFIKTYSLNKKLLSQQRFVKISGTRHHPALQAEINIVLSGNYTYTNDSGIITRVSFTRDGHLSGLGSPGVYSVEANNDKNSPAFDYFFFSTGREGDSTIYWHYERVEDTLFLYPTTLGNTAEPTVREKAKYKLVKTK